MSKLMAVLAAAVSLLATAATANTTAQAFAVSNMMEALTIEPTAGPNFGLPPPASVIVSHGGLEWIWAAPCASDPPSCGTPTPAHGFDDPTAAQWALWATRGDLVTAFTLSPGVAICASPWMSAFHSHCDYSDAVNGHIWQATGLCDPAFFNGCVASTTETFFVRRAQVVPEPHTVSLVLAGLGVAGLIRQRRRRHQA